LQPQTIGRASLAWFAISVAMFIAAIWLTVTITWIDDNRRGYGEPLYLGVMVPHDAAGDLDSFAVLYTESISQHKGSATFSIPRDDLAVLLVSNLTGEQACEIPAIPGLSDRSIPLAVRHIDWLTNLPDLYAIIAPPAGSGTIVCETNGPSRPVSFMGRQVSIEYPSEVLFTATASSPDAETRRQAFLAETGRSGFQALGDLKMDFHAEGADGIHFDGGRETGDPLFGGTWRSLKDGEAMTISWSDIHRQQFRDILLIVIGTLIGIGVTVLIEGLRPIIETLGKKSSPPPEEKSSPPPAGT
jgi:hypothetical protein